MRRSLCFWPTGRSRGCCLSPSDRVWPQKVIYELNEPAVSEVTLTSHSDAAETVTLVSTAIGGVDEAREVDRLVRAFNPSPGAFTRWKDKLLKVYRGEVREGQAMKQAGTVVWAGTDFVEVGTSKDSFLIREVQMQGGRRMSIRDFLSGHPIPVGTTFH